MDAAAAAPSSCSGAGTSAQPPLLPIGPREATAQSAGFARASWHHTYSRKQKSLGLLCSKPLPLPCVHVEGSLQFFNNKYLAFCPKQVGVGSLKKLQMVIDSVHSAEGTVQLSSLYENFTKTSSSERDLEEGDKKSHLEPSVPDRYCEGRLTSHTSGSNSLSLSGSQSSNSSHGCSGGSKRNSMTVLLSL